MTFTPPVPVAAADIRAMAELLATAAAHDPHGRVTNELFTIRTYCSAIPKKGE